MKVILDIGSNNGFNSLAFAILNPNIKVFSFEPNPYLKKITPWNASFNISEAREHKGSLNLQSVSVDFESIKN